MGLHECIIQNQFAQMIELGEKLTAYERTNLTPEQVIALKAIAFELMTRDGGIPCEWCSSGNTVNCLCEVCQDSEFNLFEFGLEKGNKLDGEDENL